MSHLQRANSQLSSIKVWELLTYFSSEHAHHFSRNISGAGSQLRVFGFIGKLYRKYLELPESKSSNWINLEDKFLCQNSAWANSWIKNRKWLTQEKQKRNTFFSSLVFSLISAGALKRYQFINPAQLMQQTNKRTKSKIMHAGIRICYAVIIAPWQCMNAAVLLGQKHITIRSKQTQQLTASQWSYIFVLQTFQTFQTFKTLKTDEGRIVVGRRRRRRVRGVQWLRNHPLLLLLLLLDRWPPTDGGESKNKDIMKFDGISKMDGVLTTARHGMYL